MKTNSLKFSKTVAINTGRLVIKIELNDECKNGHQDFAITADLYEGRMEVAGGCLHDEILRHAPEFEPFVRLHGRDYKGAPTYAQANGVYFIKTESDEYCKEYFRCNDSELMGLKTAAITGDKLYFNYILHQMGIANRWEKEANQAIKLLESLTGDTFVNDSVKSNLEPLTEAQLNDIKAKEASGYYSTEAIKQRAEDRRKSKLAKEIKNVEEEAADKIEEIKKKRDIDVMFIKSGIPRFSHIYYDHENRIVFNWSSDEITREQAVKAVSDNDAYLKKHRIICYFEEIAINEL